MRPRSGFYILAVLVVLVTFATEVRSMREGRVSIHSLNLAQTPPFVISNPGHYILTRDIDITTAGHAIIIDSDCVELNLNGKRIVHSGSAVGDNLIQIVDGRTDVTIYNGWLRGGYRGIDHEPLPPAPTGIRVRIRDVEILEAADRGISLSGIGNAELISNQVRDVGGLSGIYVDGNGDSFTGRFVDNTVENVDEFGIYLEGFEGGDLIRNVVRRFNTASASAHGILVDGPPQFVGGNLIKDNTISFGGGSGLFVGDFSRNNLIEGNTFYRNSGAGLELGSGAGNKIKNNTVGDNLGDGILVGSISDRNVIDDNHLEGNAGVGIRFSNGPTANVCRDNTVQGGPIWAGSPQIDLGGNLPAPLCF